MKNYMILSYVLILFYVTCHHALARPDQMLSSMTTEEPKMTEQSMPMTTDSDDNSDEDSSESGDKDDPESTEDEINVNPKSAFTCPTRAGDLENIEVQCIAEYKAMKKAKCNTTATDEDKMKKMGAMESMESGHSQHMGKREAPEEDMNATDAMTSTMKPMRHCKRSCHYYHCILMELDVLEESTKLPNEDMFKTWISNNVTEEEKTKLQERATECFNDLREAGFYSMDNSKSQEVSSEAPAPRRGKPCSAALKLVKCLSKQDTECPTFKFP